MRHLLFILFFVTFSAYSAESSDDALAVANLLVMSDEDIQKSIIELTDNQIKGAPEMAEHRDLIISIYRKFVTREKIMEGFAQVYESNFTARELQLLKKFYSTEAGRKAWRNKQKLNQELGNMAAMHFKEAVPEIKKIIAANMNEK